MSKNVANKLLTENGQFLMRSARSKLNDRILYC
ncbi:unnamed protein product [Thelazia callipaeda]|uniref:SH2 domain-containing protein n=1 Tax=Thelazia callipaeda TaxID=103827 RepID=A0A0N5DC59_THECL|nr:unnamed protein product [Thelazia callipaeda]